jgi:hypothetical protein
MWNVPLRVGMVASLAALSVLAEGRSKDREVAGSQHIVVAVFNRAGAPAETVLRAETMAAKIYESGGLVIHWKNCSIEEQPNLERCGGANNPGELVLNIEHQGQTGSADAYGMAFLGQDGRGKFCDVFYDRILELHHSGRASEETILGIVAAHELGHLLLGLGSHSDTGIMRPQIQSQNFLAPEFGFQITPQQLQKIRERQKQISILNESR